MEQEARELLEAGLGSARSRASLISDETIRRRFAALGGVDLKIPPRAAIPRSGKSVQVSAVNASILDTNVISEPMQPSPSPRVWHGGRKQQQARFSSRR